MAKKNQTSKKPRPIRITQKCKAHEDEIRRTVEDLKPSKFHVAWGRNERVYELFYRLDGKTPILWRADADTPLDEEGYRSANAVALVTGRNAITDLVKRSIGRSPGQIGIRFPKSASAGTRNGTTAASAAGGGGAKERKREQPSALDEAAETLKEANQPLSAKEIIEAMRSRGLGASLKGKTPHATIYSAIIREIAQKGDDSRFTKVDRGRFASNANGKGA